MEIITIFSRGLFFTPEAMLPEGVGFARFGPEHLAALGVLGALTALVVLIGCRLGAKGRVGLLRWMAGMMVVMEVGKDTVLAVQGAFSPGYLPLHLCSLAMAVCLWFAWRPQSPLAGDLVWCICLSGGVAALLLPDWTDMPLWQFQSIHSFLYHAMLVQFSLIAVLGGMARPRPRKLWQVLLVLYGTGGLVYAVNCWLGTNFMFLRRPLPGTPLMLCARLPGQWGYLVGYGLLAALVLGILEFPFWFYPKKEGVEK